LQWGQQSSRARNPVDTILVAFALVSLPLPFKNIVYRAWHDRGVMQNVHATLDKLRANLPPY
jgi:hypothetical protein